MSVCMNIKCKYYIYGVAEQWVNLKFTLNKNKEYENSSENADMSNEKGE